MGPFIQHLVDEHKQIKLLLAFLSQKVGSVLAGALDDAKLVNDILDRVSFLVEFVHHGKEEELLFPALIDKNCLNQGGPKCTYFMGLRLDSNPCDFIFSEAQRRSPPMKVPDWNPQLADLLKRNQFLEVPCEEHAAGSLAVKMMKEEVLHIINDRVDQLSKLSKIHSEYQRLLRLHIEKEDNCLFLIADSSLSHVEQVSLLNLAVEKNRELKVSP